MVTKAPIRPPPSRISEEGSGVVSPELPIMSIGTKESCLERRSAAKAVGDVAGVELDPTMLSSQAVHPV